MNYDEKELRDAIRRHPAGSKRRLKLSAITTYYCCDHCGINFMMDSACNTHPDSHTAPCNEPGCEKGTQVANF